MLTLCALLQSCMRFNSNFSSAGGWYIPHPTLRLEYAILRTVYLDAGLWWACWRRCIVVGVLAMGEAGGMRGSRVPPHCFFAT